MGKAVRVFKSLQLRIHISPNILQIAIRHGLIKPCVYNALKLPQWLTSKESACSAGDKGDVSLIPGSSQKDTLEEGKATHSSILAWRIP